MIKILFVFHAVFRTVHAKIRRVCWLLLILSSWGAQAQERFSPLPRFDFPDGPLTIIQSVNPKNAFTVAGERGAIFGQQDGSCEIWAFPVKILERLQITARVDDYQVPINMNAQASTI